MERVFTQQDQEDFGSLSGDRNPMHVDPVHARRLLLGKTVVHGVHALLWGLDQAMEEGSPKRISSLDVRFFKPIAVGQHVSLQHKIEGEALTLEILSGAESLLHAKVTLSATADAPKDVEASLPPVETCATLNADAMQCELQESACLHLEPSLAQRLFPTLCNTLPTDQLAALLLTSKVIGMRCPGLHSIFAGIKLCAPDTPCDTNFSLHGFDDRFSFATINFASPALSGTLTAFLRPEPAEQPSYEALAATVEEGEFSDIRALIIGGSRGLGEVTAKLLAAGGADVKVTYVLGADDAAALTQDIQANGGKCAHHQLDILQPESGMSEILEDWRPTDIYYYPTPPIFDGNKKQYSSELFTKFCRFYVHGFMAVLTAVNIEAAPLRVLYPSTVAVTDLPPDMLEYASAKAAGETLCANLNAQYKELDIVMPRFPRLDTDQTASLYPVHNAAPGPIILETIRDMVREG